METGCVRRAWGFALAVCAVSGFAATFVFGGALTRDCGISPAVLSFLRFLIAGLALLLSEAVTRSGRARLFAPTRRDWMAFLWLAPVGTSLMAWCVFRGCARVSTANASMADALTPLMIFAVNALTTRRVSVRGLLGLACGFVGAVLVIQVVHSGGVALDAYSVGDVYILLSAALWGVYTVCGREPSCRLGASVFTTWTMLIGAAMMGLAVLVGDCVWPMTRRAWLLTLGLGVVSTLLPFWTWNAAQRFLPVSTLGMTAYFTPVIAVALGIVFLGETATPLQWLGTAFVIASAVVETAGKRRIGVGTAKTKSAAKP